MAKTKQKTYLMNLAALGTYIVSRNMARDGQEMEDYSVMTPSLLLRRSDRKRGCCY